MPANIDHENILYCYTQDLDQYIFVVGDLPGIPGILVYSISSYQVSSCGKL